VLVALVSAAGIWVKSSIYFYLPLTLASPQGDEIAVILSAAKYLKTLLRNKVFMNDIIGCGLGLRSEFIKDVKYLQDKPNWFEIVPENWFNIPQEFKKDFEYIANNFNLVAHGLSLSIGSCEDVDLNFLKRLKEFLDRYNIKYYSEHISFTSLEGVQSYELLPLPMNEEILKKIVQKIDIVQNYLKRELILENATYYFVPSSTMSESEFINEIFKRSGAKMLLDINNVFVNSFNHKFDAIEFLDSLDFSKVAYYHIAGHLEYEDDLYIDTHGAKVKQEVWELLQYALKRKKVPVLLERDNNIPPLKVLIKEYYKLKEIYENA
jgi:uncharacterized protein (UPF0276 family)